MAGRRCPICQTVSEPRVDDGRELCSNCGLQLPPADARPPAPPQSPSPPRPPEGPLVLEPDPPRTSPPPRRGSDDPPPRDRDSRDRDSRDRDQYERPRRPEQPSSGGGKVGLAVALLLAAFVLLIFFYGGVVLIKTKPTPTTKPVSSPTFRNMNDPWGQPRDPWDR